MKIARGKHGREPGMMLLMIGVAIVTASSITAFRFYKTTQLEFRLARNKAYGLMSHYCAKAGFEAALMGLTQIPEKYLYRQGMMYDVSPMLTLGKCTVYFRLIAEDGKINLNHLVNDFDGAQNDKARAILNNLFESLDINYQDLDKLVDYMDPDSAKLPFGLEKDDYDLLKPPRRIKNGYLFGLQEMLAVPGFGHSTLYESRKPADWDQRHSTDFATDIEKQMRKDSDWILANNITAFARSDTAEELKININSTGYFVLRALEPAIMTDAAIKKIFEAIVAADFYLDNVDKLKAIPEFAAKYDNTLSNFDFYLKDRIKPSGRYYKVLGYGIAEKTGETEAVIEGILDKQTKKLLWYKEQ